MHLTIEKQNSQKKFVDKNEIINETVKHIYSNV
jgi:hypothetical protein